MNNEEMTQEEEFLDVRAIVLRYLRYLRRRWILLLILAVLGACCGFLYAQLNRSASYSGDAVYTLEKSSSVMTNATLAARLAKGVSTITKTVDFRNQMNQALGTDASGYSISAVETTDANIMTVYVTSGDMDLTNRILENFKDVYTPWATNLVGSCTLNMTDQDECYGAVVSGPSRMKMLILGFLVGVFLWFLIATFCLLTQNTILDSSQMEKITMSTCVGLIPEIEKKKREKSTREPLLMSTKNINHEYQQSVRQIRHELEKRMTGKKSLLVTSTLEGEGKSLIALNLAYDLKKRGKKVAVIDADFNHHGLAGLLQVQENGESVDNPEMGKTLLDYLTEEDPLPGNLAAELPEFDGIAVLFGSRTSAKAVDYLNVGRFGQILNALKRSYDYILIDTSPVGKMGDAILFSEAVDAVWYIVRCNSADAPSIRRGMAPFYRNGKLDGYIINRTEDMDTEYEYGRHHHYGYGYGRGYHYGYGSKYGSSYGSGYGSAYGESGKNDSKETGENVRNDNNMLDW